MGHRFVFCPNSETRELTTFFHQLRKNGSDTTRQGLPVVTIDDVASKLQQYKHFHILRKSDVAAKVMATAKPDSPSSTLTVDEWLAYAEKKSMFLKRLFQEFDTSGSGSINRHEFKKALESIRLSPSEDQVRAMIKTIDRPSGPGGVCPPNGKIEWSEFRDFMLLANPTGRFVDFSLLADDWLSHCDELTGASSVGTGKAQTATVKPWQSAIAGALGNAWSRTAIAPLERMRMQMITDAGRYPNPWNCVVSIYREEGVRGLWRGNSINVMRIAPQGALAFWAKDFFKGLLTPEGGKAQWYHTLSASMLSGIVCQTGVYPLDTIRTRMTVTPGLYSGVIDGTKKILASEGPSGLFKGLLAANGFAVPYYGTQFFTYDMLKETYSTFNMPEGEKRVINPLISIPFGSIAACTSCFVAFPFQMVWKRVQVQGIGDRPMKYTGSMNCFTTVLKEEGLRGVYAGLPANLIKLIPTGALTFLGVECIKSALGWK